MFNMSGTEIIVILLLALVVLGPEKLPDAIRKFGRTYAELKKMGTGFQQEFKSAIDEPMREMRETADLLKKSVDFTTTESKPVSDGAPTPVADTVTDRPTRNDGIAPADPDLVPTDDVPFTTDDDAPVDDAAPNGDETITDDDDDTVPDVHADVPASDGRPDEPADRGEADDA